MVGVVVLATEARTEALTAALVREIGMASEDATEVASFVISAFDGRDEVDDMDLPPDLRSIFYTLEGHRLLTFRRDEFINDDGEVRRVFHWQFRWENIVQSPVAAPNAARERGNVYDRLPRDAWRRAVV